MAGQGAVMIPVRFMEDVETVLHHCAGTHEALELYPVLHDTGGVAWAASADTVVGHGDTPFGAIVSLARILEAMG